MPTRYLNLFPNNAIKLPEFGDYKFTYRLPQEFCMNSGTERKIKIINYHFWSIQGIWREEDVYEYSYSPDQHARLCADFNTDSPENDGFVSFGNIVGNYSHTKEYLFNTNKTTITFTLEDLIGNYYKWAELDLPGGKKPLYTFCIELELIY